jgi:UDP:flavonoid glycosyltransferase YjiC (YdhE family)
MTVKRISFVAPPFAGHLNPLLELAKAASIAGYEVTMITGEAKIPSVMALGIHATALMCLNDKKLERIANTEKPVRGNPLRLFDQLQRSLAVVTEARREIKTLWQNARPDLVVADSVAVAAGLAATDLGLPWITTIATPFAIECRSGTPSYVGGWSEGSTILHKLRNAAGRFLVRRVKKGLAYAVRHQLAILGTEVYRSNGSEACYSPTSILGFGLRELEFERDWPPPFRMIGPLYRNPEPVAMPTLPSTRPRVLVTLGTHLPWAKSKLAEDIIWLAAHRPRISFIGSLGDIGSNNEALALADNATLHNFIPYSEGLPSFDAIIHHGGAGITYAAIAAGKPAIVVPHDYDQFDYAARIVAKGAGLRVARLRSKATLAALDRVLIPENFSNLSKLAEAAKHYKPHEAFLAEVTKLIGS